MAGEAAPTTYYPNQGSFQRRFIATRDAGTYPNQGSSKWQAWHPRSLDNLFALYDADDLSDVTVAEDSFTDTDGTLLSAHTADSGHSWTLSPTGKFTVNSNKVAHDNSSAHSVALVTASADGVVKADVTWSTTDYEGVAFRGTDYATMMAARLEASGTLQLIKRSSGTQTTLVSDSSYSPTSGDTHTIRVAFHSNRVRVWIHDAGTEVDYGATHPNIDHTMSSADYSAFGTSTGCGLYAYSATGSFDNFTVSTLDQSADHTVAFDSFDRADSTTLGSTEVGSLAWSLLNAQTAEISNNKMVGTTGTSWAAPVVDAGVADGVVEADITQGTTTGDNSGLILRAIDGTNHLYIQFRNSGGHNVIRLYKHEAGSHTALADDPFVEGDASGGHLRVLMISNRILVFVNDALRIDHTLSSADQTTFGAATQHGAFIDTDTATVDNFRVRRLTRVPVWPDTSRTGDDRVNANHAANTTEAQQPVLVEDWHEAGGATVLFDGAGGGLRTTFASTLAQPTTYHAIARLLAAGSDNSYMFDASGISAVVDRQLIYSPGSSLWSIYAGTVRQSGVASDNDPHVFIGLMNGASSSLRLDGTQIASGDAGANSAPGLTIGNRASLASSTAWQGEISLLAMEDAATAQAEKFEQWAADKYPEVTLA